jgi:hypothetical protein
MRSRIPGAVLVTVFLAASPAVAEEVVGIAVCDELLAKYEACVTEKAPPDQRVTIVNNIRQMRSSWRQVLATSPQSRADLEATCRDSMETLKRSLSGAYGCTF